jgi:hypothetical protein
MATMVEWNDDSANIGIPDMLVQLTMKKGETFPLWAIESSFSQPAEAAHDKLKHYVDGSPDIVGVTLFDITEADKHVPPADNWAVEQGLNKGEVFNYIDWFENGDNIMDANAGGIKSLSHTWVSLLVVKVFTWVRPPSGEFVLPRDSPNDCFSFAVSHGGGRVV